MVKQLSLIILILVLIQMMNQFLVWSGNALYALLEPGMATPLFLVGVFQQLFQAGLGVGIYLLLFRDGLVGLGINFRNRQLSLRYLWIFAVAWLSVIAMYLAGSYLFVPAVWESMRNAPLPTGDRMAGTLVFQLIFPGIGEEILFRGLVISVLSRFVFEGSNDSRFRTGALALVSAAYFATAHIYFTLRPFAITHIDFTQLAMALGCGVFYAVVYVRTKSLAAPIIAHNFSNVTSTIAGYLVSSL